MRGPAGFGSFSAQSGGSKKIGLLYIPGKFRQSAGQHAGKQDDKNKKP
jgi:hypothetical protein